MALPSGGCPGPRSAFGASRRGFLQAGLAGFASLSLPEILRLKAQAASAAGAAREKTAVIMVWQPGRLVAH